MSTFCGFVVLGEAKKRKISTKGEELLLQLLVAVKDITAEAGEEPVAMSRGANKGTAARYNELQPATTSREEDFSILAVTHCSRR